MKTTFGQICLELTKIERYSIAFDDKQGRTSKENKFNRKFQVNSLKAKRQGKTVLVLAKVTVEYRLRKFERLFDKRRKQSL